VVENSRLEAVVTSRVGPTDRGEVVHVCVGDKENYLKIFEEHTLILSMNLALIVILLWRKAPQ